MTRLLVVGIGLLLALVLIGRLQRGAPEAAVGQPGLAVPRTATQPSRPSVPVLSVSQPGGTPAIDLLARMESRRRLLAEASSTYFDSLFSETDSVLRRWPDGMPALVVAIPPDPSQPNSGLAELVQRALAVWESADLDLRFTLSADSSGAQIVVHSVAQLPGLRAGETNLGWTPDGVIRSAVISLARRDSTGREIPPEAALAIAVHEVGHALGMPHSPEPQDAMFAVAKAIRLSERDLATYRLLYVLPLGPVAEPRQP